MATYNQVSYGSKGSDVTELQKLLNQNGYSLKEDGIFGDKTQAAVKDYQQKNNLSVDGIVGTNTWGALNGTYTANNNINSAAANTTTAETTPAADTGFKYDAYQASDTVKQAQALLQQQQASKPGAYQSQWQGQLDDIIGQILNRDKFSYNLNEDALYQQYANQYINQGRMAMMDTMGQAAAMTGGYGNSYAQSVGQQAYQSHLQQLNDKIPDLYQLALQQYQMEGNALLDQYSMLGTQEEQDYGRYRDQVSDWGVELDRLQNQYNAERDYDYGKWADGRDFGYGQYIDDRNYQYQTDRDKVADEQWQKQYDEELRRWNFANKQGEYAPNVVASSGGSSGSGGSGKVYDTHGYTTEEIKAMQAAAGITVDGVWGPQTEKAYNAGYTGQTQLSGAGQDFLKNLPYAHAGSDPQAWKDLADSRLEQAYNSNKVTAQDVIIISKQLGLK